ncbi:hypothetical protein CQ045_03795 [Microbacterium sp. MYb66]|nr:hypothetical protein CQ045_03795 [Microbacterium sp. MYb66]
MVTVNHMVKAGFDLNLAMIEGTPIEAWCGERFTPSVTVGTSGRADVPGAPHCDRCQEVVDNWRKFIRLKDEKNRLIREMRAVEKLQGTLQKQWRKERERSGNLAPQLA